MAPRTIQIFLPDGNARSIRIAEVTSRTVRAIQVPRSKLKEAEARPEVNCVGLYFLFGDPEEGAKPLVYVGEAEDCCARLRQHTQGKDFWTSAIVVSAKDGSFTKTHVKYLEAHSHSAALRADRYRLQNTATPAKPYVPEPLEADVLDSFETVRVLLSTLGFPVFEELSLPSSPSETLRCAGRGGDAVGFLAEDGFVVRRGSVIAAAESDAADSWVRNVRARLKEDGIIATDNGVSRFSADYLFGSPSTAAIAILGRRANGWTAWRNTEGKTLDELERQ